MLTAASLRADDITTLSGEKFIGVTISRAEPDGLVVIKSDGIVKIPFSDLSPELRAKYGYDPQKAAQYNAAVQAAAAQFNAGVQAAPTQGQAAQQGIEEGKKNAKWIVGKVVAVRDNGILLDPPNQGDSGDYELGATELARQRFRQERASLDAAFQEYLAKGGTFFRSVRGMRYIAQHWIKAPDDYQKYFSLTELHQAKNFLGSLGVFPPIDTEEAVFVRYTSRRNVVDGDYLSLWLVEDGTVESEGGKTYRAYKLLGSN